METRLVIDNGAAPARKPNQPLVDARGHAYIDALTDGAGRDRLQVAQLFGVHAQEISRLLPLAFLSPHLAEAILRGRQPADLSVRELVRGIELPLSWAEQASLLAV